MICKLLPSKKKKAISFTLGQVDWQYIDGQYIAQCKRAFRKKRKKEAF